MLTIYSTSPSVYVVYTSLQATYACENGPITTLGSAYEKKTIGYSSRFLAYGTLSSPDQRCDENVVVDGFHTIDFTDLFYHPITMSTTSKAGCPPYVNPRLSMPAELTDIDAAWKTCQPLHYGAFDPPRILSRIDGPLSPIQDKPSPTPVSVAEPVLTSSQSTSSVSIPATQAPHIPAIPSPTSNVQAATPLLSPVANDPAGSSPSTHVIASPSQAEAQQPNVKVSVQPQASKDPTSELATQASTAVPAENAQSSPNPSTSPKPKSDSPQTTGLPQIVPVAVLPSDIAVTAQGSNPIVVLPKGVVGQLGDSPGLQGQSGNAGSGETQTRANPGEQGATSGGNPTTNNAPILVDPKSSSAPIIIALPKAQPKESPGSGVVHSNGDSHASSALPNGQDEVSSRSGASAEAGSQTRIPNLASPILFGLSGPTPAGQSGASGNSGDVDGSISPNGAVNLDGTGSSGGVGGPTGVVNVDPASTQSEPLQLAVLQAPTPLAIGTHLVALAPHGAVVVASETISSGQQAVINGTSISVGVNSDLVIGGNTHSFAHPAAPEAVESTIYAPTTQLHTLAAGAKTTINGIATTNTLPSAVIISQTTNVAKTTAFPFSGDQTQDPANIVYSTTVRESTLQPGDSATLENSFITTNTAPTPLVLSQTSSIPVRTILPDTPIPTTLYSPSPITTTIPPGSVFTVSGSVATNLASSSLILTEETNIPVSTITKPSSESGSGQSQTQIFEIDGQLLTQTAGVYGLSKLSVHAVTASASGSQGQSDEAMTLEILDSSTTSTTVVTVPASLASQLQMSSARGSSSSKLVGDKNIAAATTAPFGSANTTATATNLAKGSRTAAVRSTSEIAATRSASGTAAVQSSNGGKLQSPVADAASAMHSTNGGLMVALWVAVCGLYVYILF